MTVIEDKLLRSERAHAVAQQNVWLARLLLFRDDLKAKHIFDELIETAESEIAKASGGFGCQAVTAMIISVNDKFFVHQSLSDFRIAAHMLAEDVCDLNDSTNRVMTAPFHASDGKAVSACKLESLR